VRTTAVLKGAYTARIQDITEALLDQLKASSANCLAFEVSAEAYLSNITVSQLPVPIRRVGLRDWTLQVKTWLAARGLKMLIYATPRWSVTGTMYTREGLVLMDKATQDLWVTNWNECPDAYLAAQPALTYDIYYNFALRCIDEFRTVKPNLDIHMTSMPFWDMTNIVTKPIPRPNIYYAFHFYLMKEGSVTHGYEQAYDAGSATAKDVLENWIFQTCKVQAAINAGLNVSLIFGADYRVPAYGYNNWDKFLIDTYSLAKVHQAESIFQAMFMTDTSDLGIYYGGMWNQAYTGLNPAGAIWLQQMPMIPITPPPPPIHVLVAAGKVIALLVAAILYAATRKR